MQTNRFTSSCCRSNRLWLTRLLRMRGKIMRSRNSRNIDLSANKQHADCRVDLDLTWDDQRSNTGEWATEWIRGDTNIITVIGKFHWMDGQRTWEEIRFDATEVSLQAMQRKRFSSLNKVEIGWILSSSESHLIDRRRRWLKDGANGKSLLWPIEAEKGVSLSSPIRSGILLSSWIDFRWMDHWLE